VGAEENIGNRDNLVVLVILTIIKLGCLIVRELIMQWFYLICTISFSSTAVTHFFFFFLKHIFMLLLFAVSQECLEGIFKCFASALKLIRL